MSPLLILLTAILSVNGQATAPTIKSIFGSFDQIGDIVSKFNFSQTDSSGQDSLYVALAPAFGDLNAETIKTLDTNFLIAIAGTNRVISKLDGTARTWSKVESVMSQNPFLEAVDAGIRRSDKYIRDDTNYFQFDKSLRPEVFQEALLFRSS
ncbi:hypothetical protein SELMODRAFT_431724 [Selaginella moellendorffii]|uniref:Uncharacterized protein n=1 Tax=Selaginella moellendorffii TaxID=88036 RepID=D8TDK7_SELML|nr:hypothetical protein SELMODRAFT_431724 [Selaginella moellendorffii]